MSGFFSGSFEPFWPHAILLTIAIVSSFAVAVGIVMENPKWSLANALVVGGVAIEAACTLLLFGFDEGISNSQKSRIDTQQSIIIGLQMKLAPRFLTLVQQGSVKKRMLKFKGQRASIGVLPETKEHTDFATQLMDVLKSAEVNVLINEAYVLNSIGAANGVVIGYTTGNQRGKEFADTLADELYKAGIEAHPLGGLAENTFHLLKPPPDRSSEGFSSVVIGVGDK